MAQQFIDRAYEDCTPVGTTTVTLLGARTGFVPIPTGDSVCLIEGISGTVLTGKWEVVEGSRSGNTFTRSRVIASSNNNNPVDFNSPAEIALVVGSEWYEGVDADIAGLRTDVDQNTSYIAAVLTDLNNHIADTNNPHSVTKSQVGLGNVDNTADADKPVSTAQQTALDAKVNLTGDTMTGSLTTLNALLSALDKQVNANAVVDVRIYDTSLDDDGGDWVDRATWQSWYHEPLNTSTRGKTRKFPKLALILLYESSNYVDIFDANDPELPMWRHNLTVNSPKNTVVAKNGKIYVGTDAGVLVLDFRKDTANEYRIGGYRYRGNISDNLGITDSWDTSKALISNNVNDIAVVTESGMSNQVAVATDKGASIINEYDEAVYDITSSHTNQNNLSINHVAFSSTSPILAGQTGEQYTTDRGLYFCDEVTADISANGYRNLLGVDAYQYEAGDPQISSLKNLFGGIIIGSNVGLTKYFDFAGSSGLKRLIRDQIDTRAAICYQETDHCTGYMPGAVKGAFLCNSKTKDRSYNLNDLTETGTITESPVATGAELKCYSGFSTAKYLQQAYNSDLDFGTGDFYAIGWVSVPDNTNYHGIFDRDSDDQAANTSGFSAAINNTGKLTCWIEGVSHNLAGLSLVSNNFYFVAMKRESGNVTLYVNDKVSSSKSMPGDVTDTNATLTIGGYWQNGFFVGGNKIALLRIGSGAPSDDLIKQIYEAERPLFRENAKCTLQGSSNDVKALSLNALNSKNDNLLTVCSADHITQFNGLVVVDDMSVVSTSIATLGSKMLRGSSSGANYTQDEMNVRELANKLGI